MCDEVVSKKPKTLNYCPDSYKIQEMRDKSADNFLPKLKFISDWFVKSTIMKNIYHALFADDDILFSDEDSDNIPFSSDELGILREDLNNISIDDTNFYEDDPKTISYARLSTKNLNNTCFN